MDFEKRIKSIEKMDGNEKLPSPPPLLNVRAYNSDGSLGELLTINLNLGKSNIQKKKGGCNA